MTGQCEVGVSTLWDLVDDVLGEAAERSLRDHLADCPACAERLSRIERLDAGLVEIAEAGQVLEPTRIGDYRVVRRLGEGGMGVVYEARQPRPDRPVAIKVMRPVGSCPSRRMRAFRREIQALGRLNHPSIATVHDAGRLDDGRFYLVMELLSGQPLDRWCEDAGLGLHDRIELVARVAEAVQHAHEQGIVHRDLKPSNVLVDETGTPHVLDFGLARFLDREDDVTMSGTVTAFGSPVGTLPYISPERLRGDPSAGTDVQADVYALGVVLYQITTGRLPYAFGTGTTAAEAQRIVENEEPPHPSRIAPGIPGALGDVIAAATEKEPRNRYATVAALADDLRRFLAGQPVSARAPGLSFHARRLLRRHGRAVVGGLLACAVVIAATGWIGAAAGADTEPVTTHLSLRRAPAHFFNYCRQIDFTADGERAVHRYSGGGPDVALAIWRRGTSTSTPLDLPHASFHSPRWSPDNEYIAMLGPEVADEKNVSVLHVATGKLTRIFTTRERDDYPLDLCWAPNGTRITFVTRTATFYDVTLDGTVRRWRFRSESPRWELGGYSPDGRWLLAAVGQHSSSPDAADLRADLWVVPSGGGRARQLTATAEREHSAVFDPDGNAIWFVRNYEAGSHLFRLRLEPGTCRPISDPERMTSAGGRWLRDLDFVGAGDLVYRVSRNESEILIEEQGSGQARPLASGTEPVLSSRSDTLYYIGRSGGLLALDVADPVEPVQLAASIERATDAFGAQPPYDVAPDGRRVAYCAAADEAFGVYEVSTGAEPRLLATTKTPVVPRWSRDGSRVAYIDDEHLLVLDHDSGEVREVAQSVWRWEAWTVQWSPREDQLVAVGYETPEEFPETNTVFLVDIATGAARRLTPIADDYKESVRWHPDGTRLSCLAYADTGELVREVRLDGRPGTVLYDEPGHWPGLGAWSPSDREYVFLCSCNAMHAILADGRVQHTGHGYRHPPRWSADGSFVWVRPRIVQYFELLHGAAERGAMR